MREVSAPFMQLTAAIAADDWQGQRFAADLRPRTIGDWDGMRRPRFLGWQAGKRLV